MPESVYGDFFQVGHNYTRNPDDPDRHQVAAEQVRIPLAHLDFYFSIFAQQRVKILFCFWPRHLNCHGLLVL